MIDDARLASATASAVLGIDTLLWGGDVMSPSGTRRLIADSWFSGDPLPEAYTHPTAQALRASGGVAAKEPDARGVEAYLRAVDVPRAIREVSAAARELSGLRGAYLDGLALALQVMWDLALERLGNGAPVAYERCVEASIGRPPSPSRPEEKRARLALKWEDLDLVASRLIVRRTLWHDQEGTPKGGRALEVPLSDEAVSTLKAHRHMKGPYVFCEPDGTRLTHSRVKDVVPFTCKKAELGKRLTTHDLRHTRHIS